jgi:hypothetical protein
MKQVSICSKHLLARISHGGEKKNRAEAVFKGIVSENFLHTKER